MIVHLLIELPNDPDTIAAVQDIAPDAFPGDPRIDATGMRAAWSISSEAISDDELASVRFLVREIVEFTAGDPKLLLHPVWVDAE